MKATNAGSAESYSHEDLLLYQNLCILGIKDTAAKNGVELTRTTFKKSSTKALEMVLYHLYVAINGEAKANKVGKPETLNIYIDGSFKTIVSYHACILQEFKNLWPVSDKNQTKEFNQVRPEFACKSPILQSCITGNSLFALT